MKKISILAIAATALLVSCDKNKTEPDTTPKPKTKTELLSAGKWQITAATYAVTIMGQTTTEDEFKDMDACDKDDFTMFAADGKFTFDEGATKCDSGASQSTTGQWSFYDNETKLIITDDGYTDTTNVDELTETVLKLSYSYTDSLTSYKAVRTFGHIN